MDWSTYNRYRECVEVLFEESDQARADFRYRNCGGRGVSEKIVADEDVRPGAMKCRGR